MKISNFKCITCSRTTDHFDKAWSTFTLGVQAPNQEPRQMYLCVQCSACIESWIRVESADDMERGGCWVAP